MVKIKMLDGKFVVSVGEITSDITNESVIEIGNEEQAVIAEKLNNKPTAPNGYDYRLRADNLEWELVAIEPEPLTDEEALTRYANTLTGASDQTLIEAAETLITERIKEE